MVDRQSLEALCESLRGGVLFPASIGDHALFSIDDTIVLCQQTLLHLS